MTREEAINAFKEWIERDKKMEYVDRLENIEIYKLAIKALEQTSALDKIRAEIIERDRTVKAVRSDNCCFFTTEEVLEIIDKYMAERMAEIDPVDIDKAVEHYDGTLEVLKGIDLEDEL